MNAKAGQDQTGSLLHVVVVSALDPSCTCIQIDDAKALVEFLLERGADLDYQDITGSTCLHYAAYQNHISMLTLLLRARARTDLEADGNTPLYLAMASGKADAAVSIVTHTHAGEDRPYGVHSLVPTKKGMVLGEGTRLNAASHR